MVKKGLSLILSFIMLLTIVCSWGCRTREFTVVFNGNGGTLVSGEEVQTVTSAEQIVAPVYEREGYILSFDKIISGLTEDTTVTAVWTARKYKLTFNGDGGTFTQKTITISLGQKLPELPIPVKEFYIFEGWFIEDQIIAKDYVWDFASDKVAIARYVLNDGNNYKIEYDLGGGTLANQKTTYSTTDETFIIGSPEKIGYDFVGWQVNNSEQLNSLVTVEKGSTEDLFLKAVYTAKTFQVSFDANGGDQVLETMSAVYDSPVESLPTTTKTGYLFTGWYYNDIVINVGQKWKIIEDSLTLIASWAKENSETYLITYDLGGGTLENQKNYYNSNEPDFYLGTPEKEGYVFKGFIKEGETKVNSEVKISSGTTGNLHFTAVWLKKYVFRFELSRIVELDTENGRPIVSCTVNGKDYVDDVWFVIGQTIELPVPTLSYEDYYFSDELSRKKYWIIDVKDEELNGRYKDDVGYVIYSGDVLTEQMANELERFIENGVITVRPRIRPRYVNPYM